MNRILKTIAAIMLMMVFALGCTKPDEPNNGGNNNEIDLNGHEFVDLGLSSGTLWATCNIGADVSEGYGDYFAWGETEPWTDYYDNKYCNREGMDDFGELSLTKYCNNPEFGYNGFSDDLTILQPIDDAAIVNWGSGWRMPTKDEWSELYDETEHIWTNKNGICGMLFKGSNGNELFLPASGSYYGEGDETLVGELGLYWASSLSDFEPCYAWYFWISEPDPMNWWHPDGCGMDDEGDFGIRMTGCTIRPVCSYTNK